ncbi:MAG TPA: type I polyketide synthase, partial [Candidatus Angelobacter sp.]|nr:type I polyketide synthase [Candidatus Angelobacter sp.]
MSAGIAIVGMACCYPDAGSPQELWENVLAQRRAFRRLPSQRLSLSDYFSADQTVADSIYTSQAALIEGYQFERPRFRVSGPIFRSVDMTHWLALDVADRALRDAGFAEAAGLPRETTGVLVGNTLTGEFSRAATLRLRWPYVRRIVEARLLEEGWEEKRRITFLEELERDYKEPFSPVGEETLAGALSNTIPGRICNYFHFGGGGYTLDGACCSSLLAVARACSALESGELDAAVAGGVDLSLDPFELVGFAKAGALARGEMRVYDRQSSGFLPGEGSGFVVLMRAEDASAQNLRSYAVIRGWGISSDGAGSITRPEVRGQMLALERAYKRAGYSPNSVALFEGHGTGTPVGDEVELQAILAVRKTAASHQKAAIGSIKANIGHTKAAAGIAGLIKAVMAVDQQILPPATGVVQPRQELQSETASLRILDRAELWPEGTALRAGVNSFGFGGINVHVTIEGGRPAHRASFSPQEDKLLCSTHDAELFLLDANSATQLAEKAECLAREAEGISLAELADVAAALAAQSNGRPWRAAVVARTPQELAERLTGLAARLRTGTTQAIDPEQNAFIGAGVSQPRIGFLFPGQASPVRLTSGFHAKRFPEIEKLYQASTLPKNEQIDSTHVAQLAIAASELAGLRLMKLLGIGASVAIGHSVGEIVAYSWAGALDEAACLRLVDLRGRLMASLPGPSGSMASICASPAEVEEISEGEQVVLACFNAPNQTVIAGPRAAVSRVVSRAQALGRNATVLSAANAFHSPLMRPMAFHFQKEVEAIALGALHRTVISTITGKQLQATGDLKTLMVQQLTAPVRFLQALQATAG